MVLKAFRHPKLDGCVDIWMCGMDPRLAGTSTNVRRSAPKVLDITVFLTGKGSYGSESWKNYSRNFRGIWP